METKNKAYIRLMKYFTDNHKDIDSDALKSFWISSMGVSFEGLTDYSCHKGEVIVEIILGRYDSSKEESLEEQFMSNPIQRFATSFSKNEEPTESDLLNEKTAMLFFDHIERLKK